MSLYIIMVLKVVIGIVILNVWLIRKNKATAYRGGQAENLNDEITYYGLPAWSYTLIGASKIILALLLISSLWIPRLSLIASLGLSAFMLGAIFMHLKVSDEFKKFVPALLVFTSCLIVVFYST